MIEERAVVVRVEGEGVFIQPFNMGNCQRCAEGRGCGGGLLGRLARHQKHAVSARTRVHDLRPGDSVVVGVSPDALLQASMLVYLLPLAGMIGAGAFAAVLLQAGDLLVAGFALAGLAAGLLLVRRISERADISRFQPVVLRREQLGADHCPRLTP